MSAPLLTSSVEALLTTVSWTTRQQIKARAIAGGVYDRRRESSNVFEEGCDRRGIAKRDSNSPLVVILMAYVIPKIEYCYEERSFQGAFSVVAERRD